MINDHSQKWRGQGEVKLHLCHQETHQVPIIWVSTHYTMHMAGKHGTRIAHKHNHERITRSRDNDA